MKLVTCVGSDQANNSIIITGLLLVSKCSCHYIYDKVPTLVML